MKKLEAKIREVGEYLGCNEGELISAMREVLSYTTEEETLEFVHGEKRKQVNLKEESNCVVEEESNCVVEEESNCVLEEVNKINIIEFLVKFKGERFIIKEIDDEEKRSIKFEIYLADSSKLYCELYSAFLKEWEKKQMDTIAEKVKNNG